MISTATGNASTGEGSHNVSIGASGSVVAYIGSAIDMLGMYNSLVNHGEITGLLDAGVTQNGDQASIQNFGSIDAHIGLALMGDGGRSDIVNAGTISAKSTAIFVNGQSINLVNTGLISVANGTGSGQAITIFNGSLSKNFITNTGTIIGDISGPTDQSIDIDNFGLIDGSIELSDQADIYDGRGGTITGMLAGNAGNDTYIVDDATINIVEGAGLGIDKVRSTVSFELGDNLDDLVLIGAENTDGTGNELDNKILGNAGDNVLRGDDGKDTINGNQGDDNLRGGKDDDSLKGGAGDDILRGGLNLDELKGGFGNDILIGGAGKDILFGQTGDDVFRFNKAAHSIDGGAADRIKDFVRGEDIIDLHNLVQGQLDFIGTANFSGTGPSEVNVSVVGNDTRVKVDVDGDGSADMRIVVEGVTTLSEADFLL